MMLFIQETVDQCYVMAICGLGVKIQIWYSNLLYGGDAKPHFFNSVTL